MKVSTMTSSITKSAAILAACFALNASAGTTSSAKTIAPVVAPEVDDSLGFEASVGYDSRYYFRGLWFSNHKVWTNLYTSVVLTENRALEVLD